MRRAPAIRCLLAGLPLVACGDAPVEAPPDPGGPGDTVGTAEGVGDDSDDDSGDGDGDGDGFQLAEPVTSEVLTFASFELADFDADGCADLLLVAEGVLRTYAGGCNGRFFGPAATVELDAAAGLAVGDLDGDARADLVIRQVDAPALAVRLAGTNFSWDPPTVTPLDALDALDALWIGDLTGDGRGELLTRNSTSQPPSLHSWTLDAAGQFAPLASSEVGSFDVAALGKLDAGPTVDFAAGLSAGPLVNPWLSDGAGALLSAEVSALADFDRLLLADLDGDGRSELVSDTPGQDFRLRVYANRADAADSGSLFAATPEQLSVQSFTVLRSADLDGDGDDDLVLAPLGQPPRVVAWRSE